MARKKDFWIDGPIPWLIDKFGSQKTSRRTGGPAKAGDANAGHTTGQSQKGRTVFGRAESRKRMIRAITECLVLSVWVPFVGIMLVILFDLWIMLLLSIILWPAAAATVFGSRRQKYRFQVAEKTQKLLVGPGYIFSVGPGHWWKGRNEDLKADNVFFTGRAPEFKAVENIEGSDEGNRVDFDAVFVYSVVIGEAYNALGDSAAAEKIVQSGIVADYRRFCRDAVKSQNSDPMSSEEILRRENTIRDEFPVFFGTLSEKYKDAWGIELDLKSSRIDNIDYDSETKALRREVAEAIRKAEAERRRQDIITVGVPDPRLALAADGKSPQVSVEAFELDLSVEGDPAIAAAVARIAGNPGALAALTGGRSKGGKK